MSKKKRPSDPPLARANAQERDEAQALIPPFERAVCAVREGREPAPEDLATLQGAGLACTFAASSVLVQQDEAGRLALITLLERLDPHSYTEWLKEAAFSDNYSLDLKEAMIGLLERWGEPQAYVQEEIRRARDLIGSLRRALDGAEAEPRREALHQTVREFSSFTRRSLIHQLALELGEQAPRAFDVLHGADEDLDNNLIQILESQRSTAAARVLLGLLERAQEKEQRKAIKRALHMLESHGIEVPQSAAPVVLAPAVREERRAHASHVDSLGDRLLWFARSTPPEGLLMVQALINDRAGLSEFELFRTSRKAYRQMLVDLKSDERMTIAELDPDHVLGLIDAAAERTRSAGREVPEEYARHRELLGSAVEPRDRPAVYRRFSADQLERLRADHEAAEAALTVKELSGWMINLRDLQPYYERIHDATASPIISSAHSKEERMNALYREVTDEFFGSEAGRPYRERLEETAELLAALGRDQDAVRVLAAALSLDGARASDSRFALGLVRRCIDLLFELQEKNKEGSLIVSPYEPPE